MGTPEMAGAAPAIAPRDPETFFKAQKRNRRATWRMSALSVFAALLMGIPLTLVLTPLVYAVTMAVAEVVNYFSPLPPEFWQNANDLAKVAYRVADVLINQRGTLDPQELAIALALLFLPGIVLALVLWAGIHLLFRHGGVGGTLASLNAREPNATDLKELQLSDAVQEMAIAAGLPPPKVMLIDSPGANAAAIGTSPADAHIVLSRRVLDDLDRDQLQALIAHLVASVGNGDLHIAFTVTSVFETCGLIVALINAPFGKQSRSTLWKIVAYPFRRGRPGQSARAEEVAELLADMIDVNSSDIDRFFDSKRPGLIRKPLRLLLFPFLFTNMAVELTLWFFLNVLLGPCMALVWRTRRYLADAGAVELTRNPDALASALQRLTEDTTALAGGSWARHLFVVNPAGDRSLRESGASSEQQRKAIDAWRASEDGAAKNIPALAARAWSTEAADKNPVVAGLGPEDLVRMRREMMSTIMAAVSGDAGAAARMQAFAQAMGGPSAFGLNGIPNFNDIALAKRGDRAALGRLRALRQDAPHESPPKRGRTGLQTYSFVSFHPPLNSREKRLQRMGAHFAFAAHKRGSVALKIFMTLMYLIIAPLMVVAGAMMLFVIGLMICLNLAFLALWLSFIHWAFAQDWARNFQALVDFVQQVSAAVSKGR